MPIASFSDSHIRKLAEILAGAYTHKELTDLLGQCGIAEQGGDPKWERVLLALRVRQQTDGCGTNVGAFIQAALDPARFVGRAQEFSDFRDHANEVLAFSGIHLGEDGKLRAVTQARTLSEAQEKANRLRSKPIERNVHYDVLQFCKADCFRKTIFMQFLRPPRALPKRYATRPD
jgi:hypothetical protein